MRSGERPAVAARLFIVLALGWAACWPAAAQPERKTPELSARELVKLAEEVEHEVAALRGWQFKRPVKKDVRTEEQLRAYIEKKLFEEEYGGGKLECLQALLRMVGLIPESCRLRQTFASVLLNQIGGFYDPDTGAFYMLRREGVTYGPLVNRMLIAHELTHALDDQYADLNKLIKSPEQTEDQTFAVAAIVEGSATVLMARYNARASRSGKYDMSELSEVLASEMERSEPFLNAPPYFSSLMANYVCGMYFLLHGDPMGAAGMGDGRGVGEKFLAAARDPPTSSEQILHPEKYWDRQNRDEPVRVRDEDVERLLQRAGVQVVHKNTLGELLCALLATPASRKLDLFQAAFPDYWTNDAGRGWGGDRFFLLAAGKDPQTARQQLKAPRGVWITMWDTRDDRDEFVEDYDTRRDLPGRRHFNLADRVAVFLFGFDAAAASELQSRLSESSLAYRCGKKRWEPRAR